LPHERTPSARPATSEKWTTRESRPITTTTDWVARRANHPIGRSSPLPKNIPLFDLPKPLLETLPSRPATRGVSGSSSTLGWDAVDAAAFCAQRDCRAGDEPVSDRQHADERCCRRREKSCGPDAPTLASSSRMLCRPYRARTQRWFAGDGGKRARSPGSTKHDSGASRREIADAYPSGRPHGRSPWPALGGVGRS
jgi:hypothetical protein